MLGKNNCQRLQNCCCSRSYIPFKKCGILAGYLFIAAATVVVLYCCNRISKMTTTNDETSTDREGERDPYEQLSHYIFHPQSPCKTPVVIGGHIGKKEKLYGEQVVCLDPGHGFGKDCIVYSFGINHEWSFEEGMHKEFGCDVYAFDPSMDMPDHLHSEGVWFYNQGVGLYNYKINGSGQIWEEKTLDSIIDEMGHTDKTIDLLRLNVEGNEFEVLEDILNKGILNSINHLCVEIHLLSNPYWTELLNLFQRIEAESGLKHFSTRNNTEVRNEQVPGFPERYEQYFLVMAWYRQEEDSFWPWMA